MAKNQMTPENIGSPKNKEPIAAKNTPNILAILTVLVTKRITKKTPTNTNKKNG